MGLFDFFKRKSQAEADDEYREEPRSLDHRRFFLLYKEYLKIFLANHGSGNDAPIAAYQDEAGILHGLLFYSTDVDHHITIGDTLHRLSLILASKIKDERIRSYVILYHADCETPDGAQDYQLSGDLANAIAIRFWLAPHPGPSKAYLRYWVDNEKLTYQGLQGLDDQANQELFGASLRPDHNYFDQAIQLVRTEKPCPNGATLVRGLRGRRELVTGGLFGFRALQDQTSAALESELARVLFQAKPVHASGNSLVVRKNFGPIPVEMASFMSVVQMIAPIAPNPQTVEIVPVRVFQWEESNGVVGSVVGRCNGQFMMAFKAIDYWMGKQTYLETNPLQVELWGLGLRLSKHVPASSTEVDELIGEGFVGFVPEQNTDYGTFNIQGKIEAAENLPHTSDALPQMRLFRIRIINAVDDKPSFAVETIVAKTNIKNDEITVGDTVHGTILFLGRIAQPPAATPA